MNERDEVEAVLAEFVDDGTLVKTANRDGLPLWGFPLGPHDHIWGSPKIDDWDRHENGNVVMTLKWRCAVPGCGKFAVMKRPVPAEAFELS